MIHLFQFFGELTGANLQEERSAQSVGQKHILTFFVRHAKTILLKSQQHSLKSLGC